jgi:hypothetical protein
MEQTKKFNNQDYELLWQCYKSGQMSEKQWQDHLKNDDGFLEWLRKQAPKDF